MNLLSRYLSHALVLLVTVAVAVYVAPAVLTAPHRTGAASTFEQVLAISQGTPRDRLVIAAAGCAAPPAISDGANLLELGRLQSRVETALNGCAARIEALNRLQASLQAQIAADTVRIATEKELLAGLARVMYRQPQNVLVALTASKSLGDFFAEWSDMQAAGARARQLNDQLVADQALLQAQRAEVQSSRAEEIGARAALQAAANRLQQVQDRLLARLAGIAAPAGFVLPAGPRQVIQDIEKAFSPLGQTAVQWALRVAKCESNYNPNAVNPYSGTEGLFQFEPSTWRSTPYGKDNVFDPWYNSLAAAWLYQHSGPGQWQCS